MCAVLVVLGPALLASWAYHCEVLYATVGQVPPYAQSKWTYTPEVAESTHDLHTYVGQIAAQDIASGTT